MGLSQNNILCAHANPNAWIQVSLIVHAFIQDFLTLDPVIIIRNYNEQNRSRRLPLVACLNLLVFDAQSHKCNSSNGLQTPTSKKAIMRERGGNAKIGSRVSLEIKCSRFSQPKGHIYTVGCQGFCQNPNGQLNHQAAHGTFWNRALDENMMILHHNFVPPQSIRFPSPKLNYHTFDSLYPFIQLISFDH